MIKQRVIQTKPRTKPSSEFESYTCYLIHCLEGLEEEKQELLEIDISFMLDEGIRDIQSDLEWIEIEIDRINRLLYPF